MDPGTRLFDNIVDNGFISILVYDILYFVGNGDQIVPGDACEWLYLVFKWSFRVALRKFEHQIDLIFKLISEIGFAIDNELLRIGLFDDLKLVEIDKGECFKLIILTLYALYICHGVC